MLMFLIQIHLSHFNSSNLVRLLIVSMFFSGAALGLVNICMTCIFRVMLSTQAAMSCQKAAVQMGLPLHCQLVCFQ